MDDWAPSLGVVAGQTRRLKGAREKVNYEGHLGGKSAQLVEERRLHQRAVEAKGASSSLLLQRSCILYPEANGRRASLRAAECRASASRGNQPR